MSVRASRNFKLRTTEFTDAKMMAEVGKLVLRLDRTRTQSGRDKDGKPFHPLSPGYAAQKREAVGSGKANLVLSGRMLNDMRVIKATKNTVSIGFTGGISGGGGSGAFIQRSRGVSGAAKAHAHANVGVGRSKIKRDFLGLTKSEENTVQKSLERAIARKLKKKR